MITTNNSGQLVIQLQNKANDYPYIMQGLLNVCKEAIASPHFDETVSDACTHVLNIAFAMLPTEQQAKAMFQGSPVNFANDIKDVANSLTTTK